MGKEPRRLEGDPLADPPEAVRRLESEIRRSRRRLDAYVDELDRRRHRLMSFRRHPLPAIGAGVAAAAVIAGIFVLVRRRAKHSARSPRRARMISDAMQRVLAHPERVASDGSIPWSRILVAAVPVILKKAADAALSRRSNSGR